MDIHTAHGRYGPISKTFPGIPTIRRSTRQSATWPLGGNGDTGRFVRPAEVDVLLGNSSRARNELGWEPEVSFKQLVEMMVDHDMELLKRKNNL